MHLSNPNEIIRPKLHANILDLLFKHQNEIHRQLSDLRGLYFIDHVAITLINPDNEMVIFSITPSVEFNLIFKGLWEYDRSFYPHCYKEGSLLFWDKAYLNGYQNIIKQTKETQHGFTLGFNVLRKSEQFNLIYSFATRQLVENLHDYYNQLTCDLLSLGDYGYKLLRSIYSQYCGPCTPPSIETNNKIKARRHLKLIVNN